jgi:hypothetical protein
MSTFKCGLRRFDGHGTSSYRPTNPEAKKEMETAYQRMMRLRDQQDQGVFSSEVEKNVVVLAKHLPVVDTRQEQHVITKQATGSCYSLSDSTTAPTSS